MKIFEEGVLKPCLPSWAHRWVFPELEGICPQNLELWDISNYDTPQGVSRSGLVFLQHLRKTGLLPRCFSLAEGNALIQSGLLLTWFPGRHLCLWRSTVLGLSYDRRGVIDQTQMELCVPWIQNIKGQDPVIRWWWLGQDLYLSHETPLFDPKLLPPPAA